jgi:outer membrane immunogenic protein
MKKQLLIASAFALASTGAFAQAKNFEGFTAGVNVSSVGGTLKLTDSVLGSINMGQQSIVAGAELGYNFAASKEVVLGLTATYDFVSSNLGQANALGDGFNFKGQNRYSINFKPGYVITPSTMVYATVGYNSMGVKGTASNGASDTTTLTGIGYGLGLAVMASKNVFVKAEVQQVNFGSKDTGGGTSLQPNLTIGTIGVGYKF